MLTLCARLGIPAGIVADMNAAAFHAGCWQPAPISCSPSTATRILSAATIDCLPHGGLNVHPGLLPDHRGPVPTIHALLADPPRFGVTIHRLVPRIDAGPILAQVHLDLPPETSALQAALHLHEAAIPLVIGVLDALARGPVPEAAVETRPYCGFPSAAQLRQLARMNRRAASWRDVVRALRTPI